MSDPKTVAAPAPAAEPRQPGELTNAEADAVSGGS